MPAILYCGQEIHDLLAELERRTTPGNKLYYKPFLEEESRKLKHYHISQCHLDLVGSDSNRFTNPAGTLLAIGYKRLVVSSYGPYIEFSPEQMQLNNIELKWAI